MAATAVGDQINVDNVLLNLVGSGQSSIEASVRGTGAVRTASGRHTVIDSVVDPLTDENVEVGQKVTLIRHTGKPMDSDRNSIWLLRNRTSTPLPAPGSSWSFPGFPRISNSWSWTRG